MAMFAVLMCVNFTSCSSDDEAPTEEGGGVVSGKKIAKIVSESGTWKETITFTFTASSETAYWVWNLANCKDSVDNQISIKVTNFGVTHASGGKMNYYNSSN